MKRRTFLGTLGTLPALLAAGHAAPALAQAPGFSAPLPEPGSPAYWPAVKALFPLPTGFCFLNTAGLGSTPVPISDVVKAWMDREDASPTPGHDEADFARVRAVCAGLLGPSCHADEVALISTATEGLNLIINAQRLQVGDEVVTSTHEHAAAVIPLLNQVRTRGVVVRTFEPDIQSAAGNVERIRELLSARTKLILVSHITCTTGQVMPIAAIGALANERNLTLAVDGAQSWCHIPFDLGATGAHYFTASGHKWILGPKRTGILWVRHDRIAATEPSIVGAYSETASSLPDRTITLRPTAQRFEFGTQNDALIYGLGAAAAFITQLGPDRVWQHNRALAERCVDGLRQLRGVEVLSPRDVSDRSAIITCRVPGRDNRQVASALTSQGIRVRSVTEAALDGVRVSFHVCNDTQDVDRFVTALGRLIAGGS
jgi:selenocysteine lyase/cysteine desulfurase